MADKVNGDLISRRALLATVRNYRLEVGTGFRPGPISSIAILRMIEQLPAIDAEPARWISVEERLPNDNEKVIVYTRSGKMCVARWSARQDKFVSSGNLTVTHWMLLPNEPKTEVRCEFAENGVDGG